MWVLERRRYGVSSWLLIGVAGGALEIGERLFVYVFRSVPMEEVDTPQCGIEKGRTKNVILPELELHGDVTC